MLIHESLDRLKKMKADGCVLVGNPDYYSRFGFKSEGRLTYRGLDSSLVQWIGFEDPPTESEITYAAAFEA